MLLKTEIFKIKIIGSLTDQSCKNISLLNLLRKNHGYIYKKINFNKNY